MGSVFDRLSSRWDRLDFVVHAIAYSDKEELKGQYVDTSQENFRRTMDVSCYPFTAVAHHAAKLMTNGGSLLSLSFYGAASAMRPLQRHGRAEGGSGGFHQVFGQRPRPSEHPGQRHLGWPHAYPSWQCHRRREGYPAARSQELRHCRVLCQEDIGGGALYFLSDLSKSVTGEIHHIDSGYNAIGMSFVDSRLE